MQDKIMTKAKKVTDEEKYASLNSLLQRLPWIVNGSVMKVAPRSSSSRARTTYIWTRKIKAKTVTVALSRKQYTAFRGAITAHRRVERTLEKMRQMSEQVPLNSLPSVKKKPRTKKIEK
jgi:hypothetical protein